MIAIKRRAARRTDSLGVDEILVGDWQAVQSSHRAATRDELVGASGIRHRPLGDQRHHGVDLRVETIDLCQVRSQYIARRYLLLAKACHELHRAHGRDFVERFPRRLCRISARVCFEVHVSTYRDSPNCAAKRSTTD